MAIIFLKWDGMGTQLYDIQVTLSQLLIESRRQPGINVLIIQGASEESHRCKNVQ